MEHGKFKDPFLSKRQNSGIGYMDDQNDPVAMVLGHKEVRKCAFDWKNFQSGATPGRIVVPSEVNIRDIRQIPFEVDPPEHGTYRALLEQWFRRPLEKEYQIALEKLIDEAITSVLNGNSFDAVTAFALPLQSKALTLLLNIPIQEADTWISWGTHVFRSDDTNLDGDKASVLFDYLDNEIEKAALSPGKDLYSVLLASTFDGRPLTKEEIKGIMILTFAGGRDTVINTITNTLAYFADHKNALLQLHEKSEHIPFAVEELIRYFSPLTQMGRVATQDTSACAHAVKKDTRISLCWASANRDERVFENPNQVLLDRKTNPHVAFGFGHHKCLGATHARELMKILLRKMASLHVTIEVHQAKEKIEHLGEFKRKVGFESLHISIKN